MVNPSYEATVSISLQSAAPINRIIFSLLWAKLGVARDIKVQGEGQAQYFFVYKSKCLPQHSQPPDCEELNAPCQKLFSCVSSISTASQTLFSLEGRSL